MKKFTVLLALAALFVACEQKPAPRVPPAPAPGEENAVPRSTEPSRPVDNTRPTNTTPASSTTVPTNGNGTNTPVNR